MLPRPPARKRGSRSAMGPSGRAPVRQGKYDRAMTMKPALAFLLTVAASVAAAPTMAQWISIRFPATPRTADGRPDLTAPAPRAADGKPDLSGIWMSVRPPIPEELRGSRASTVRY